MGLFGKKKGLVGVDIGSSAVKAVELKVGGKGGDEFQLLNIGLEPLPPEAIVDGAIMDSGAVIDAVQNLFQDNRIKKLYELGKELNWNAEMDIDWDRPWPEQEKAPGEFRVS